MANISAAVITGGHAYGVIPFRKLFERLDGVSAVVQHVDDFCSSAKAVRQAYDVLVFYTMMPGTPSDNGPSYAGRQLEALSELGQGEQGILVLHHAVLSWPTWSVFDEIVGIDVRNPGKDFIYHHDQQLTIEVTEPGHPIVNGIEDFEMVDETYLMNEPDNESLILLKTEKTESMSAVGWVRKYGKSRVFCYVSGHDAAAYESEIFRRILRRGIEWCAGGP